MHCPSEFRLWLKKNCFKILYTIIYNSGITLVQCLDKGRKPTTDGAVRLKTT